MNIGVIDFVKIRMLSLSLIILLVGSFLNIEDVDAIRPVNSYTLSVFLDLPASADADFIRQEIPVVEYVRDRQLANVHIIMSQHPVGTSGSTYSISFIGRGEYQDKNYQLSYLASGSSTSDEIRRGYTEKIKMGLIPFIAESFVTDRIDIKFIIDDTEDTLPYEDPWNYWVIEVYGGGNLIKEETRNSLHISYGIFADRITKESKTRLRPYGNYYERSFKTDESWITTTRLRGGFDSYHIISLSDHWGTGVFGDIYISTFDNLDFSAEISPAIEYSLFPYEEATRRSITLAWRAGIGYYDYLEETIFDKTEDFLFGQAIILSADFRQPWGSVRAGLIGFHHFHDFRSNSTKLSGSVNLRLIEGLSLNLATSFSLINDQVAIPKGEMTRDEILLEQRRRASSYDFSANIGLSYIFGSRITGVFNPRLSH